MKPTSSGKTPACPPELGRRPTVGDLLLGKALCAAVYCGWCCGCPACQLRDAEWIKREEQRT